MEYSTQFPLHPKRRRVMTRNWSAEPEDRVIRGIGYRRTRYGQGSEPPPSTMVRNMRQQEEFRRVQSE
jgi:hypothetical protein